MFLNSNVVANVVSNRKVRHRNLIRVSKRIEKDVMRICRWLINSAALLFRMSLLW